MKNQELERKRLMKLTDWQNLRELGEFHLLFIVYLELFTFRIEMLLAAPFINFMKNILENIMLLCFSKYSMCRKSWHCVGSHFFWSKCGWGLQRPYQEDKIFWCFWNIVWVIDTSVWVTLVNCSGDRYVERVYGFWSYVLDKGYCTVCFFPRSQFI